MGTFAEYDGYDALGLAELIRKKEAMPEEVCEAAIARIASFLSARFPTRTTACSTMASTAAFTPKNSAETKPTSPQMA